MKKAEYKEKKGKKKDYRKIRWGRGKIKEQREKQKYKIKA